MAFGELEKDLAIAISFPSGMKATLMEIVRLLNPPRCDWSSKARPPIKTVRLHREISSICDARIDASRVDGILRLGTKDLSAQTSMKLDTHPT